MACRMLIRSRGLTPMALSACTNWFSDVLGVYPETIVTRPGFKNQHTIFPARTELIGQDAPGGACADDNKINFPLSHGPIESD